MSLSPLQFFSFYAAVYHNLFTALLYITTQSNMLQPVENQLYYMYKI